MEKYNRKKLKIITIPSKVSSSKFVIFLLLKGNLLS